MIPDCFDCLLHHYIKKKNSNFIYLLLIIFKIRIILQTIVIFLITYIFANHNMESISLRVIQLYKSLHKDLPSSHSFFFLFLFFVDIFFLFLFLFLLCHFGFTTFVKHVFYVAYLVMKSIRYVLYLIAYLNHFLRIFFNIYLINYLTNYLIISSSSCRPLRYLERLVYCSSIKWS